MIGRGLRAAIDMKKLGERQILLDCRGAQHPRIAHTNEARRRRGRQEARLDADWPQLVRGTTIGATQRRRLIGGRSHAADSRWPADVSPCRAALAARSAAGRRSAQVSPSASSSAYSLICWYMFSIASANAA